MDINDTKELFHELFILWALFELGGEADDEVLYQKSNEMVQLNHDKTLRDIINEMIKSGYPEDRLIGFLEMHGIPMSLDNETVH